MPNGKKLTLTFTVDEARMIADALGTSLQEIGGSILSLRKVPSEDETVKCLRTTQKAITDFRERFDNAVTEAEGRRTVICSKCGGANVQHAAWVRPNTGEVVNDEGPTDDTWCEDCKELTRLS